MKDKCVLCGVATLYDKEEHIDFRIGYVEGCGQLCLNCSNVGWKGIVDAEPNDMLLGGKLRALRNKVKEKE
tara:strand:- start:2170 stop:2382 length:213 start_codon:yes stop_codon:yes gene_type:complete